MPQHVIHAAIFLAFYIVGAFSTTDILRLLKGSTVSVSCPDCFCPACGSRLPLHDQIPVFSYLLNRGSCRFCGSKIPISELFSELTVFFTLSAISILSGFSYGGLFLCFLFYQIIKFIYLLKVGPRKDHFIRNLFFSLLHDIMLFGLLFFLFFLEHLIS